jgi:RimJ/RimL family protein N-acetyltransferase
VDPNRPDIKSIDDANISLSSTRIALRPMAPADAPRIQAYSSDSRVLEHLALQPQTLAQTEDYIADALADSARRPRIRYRLSVVPREPGEPIGDCVLRIDLPVIDQQGEIGFVLSPDRWNRGFGTEVARLLVRLGLHGVGLHRVYAHVRPENAASIRVLEKVGMRLEGRLREHRLIRGVWRDSLVYAVLDSDRPS